MRTLIRLIGAVVTGVATLFAMRADPSEHWATPPTVVLVDTEQDSIAGDP